MASRRCGCVCGFAWIEKKVVGFFFQGKGETHKKREKKT